MSRTDRYEKLEVWGIVEVPLPTLRPGDVLIKVKACGVCGTDLHIHEGEFIAEFPLIPGHETIGEVVGFADDVKAFKVGDRVAADNFELCGHCFYCRRGDELLCEDFKAHGILGLDGGFAEYCSYPQGRLFKINNLSDVDATLIEPASCAMHGLEKIAPRPGSHALLIGAGPTGLMMAQFLQAGGWGEKMDLAKNLDAADFYVPLSRTNAAPQWEQIKKDNPYGFDIGMLPPMRRIFVPKARYLASGSAKVLEDAINYVRRGGKLEQWGEALESIRNKSAIKAAIVFD
ncbi:GroES-like protein [Poronia punctata]|nr:GroES-like protein [Poronia punctata]